MIRHKSFSVVKKKIILILLQTFSRSSLSYALFSILSQLLLLSFSHFISLECSLVLHSWKRNVLNRVRNLRTYVVLTIQHTKLYGKIEERVHMITLDSVSTNRAILGDFYALRLFSSNTVSHNLFSRVCHCNILILTYCMVIFVRKPIVLYVHRVNKDEPFGISFFFFFCIIPTLLWNMILFMLMSTMQLCQWTKIII